MLIRLADFLLGQTNVFRSRRRSQRSPHSQRSSSRQVSVSPVRQTQQLEDRALLSSITLSTNVQTIDTTADSTFTFDVLEEVLDDDGNTFNGGTRGVSVRVFFNSSQVTFDSISNVASFGFPPSAGSVADQIVADDTDLDSDSTTDSLVTLAWLDFASNFPPTDTPQPFRLFTASFSTTASFSGSTTINFNGPDGSSNALAGAFEVVALNSVTVQEDSPNQAPTAVSLDNATTTLPELTSTAGGLVVADINITDDGQGTNDISLSGTDAGLFEVSAGQLRIRDGVALDFETNSTLDVTVNVDDTSVGTTPDASAALSISITDVNEAPVDVSLSSQTTILAENTVTAGGVVVADITVTDDALGTNDISLTGADASLFEVSAGQLRLRDGVSLDFESNPTLDVTVNVDDTSVGASPDASTSLSITVTDVLEDSVDLPDGGGSYEVQRDGTDIVVRVENGSEILRQNASLISSLSINGSASADIVVVLNAGIAVDTPLIFRGDSGNDSFDATEATGSVTLAGERGDDVLIGGSNDDVLRGGAGRDRLSGLAGNDRVLGQGATGDHVSGGAGDDIIDGGAGNDLLFETADTDFELTSSSMTGLGNDSILSVERARLIGGESDNSIDASGFSGRVILIGLGGNDRLLGTAGQDILRGGAGSDILLGGPGADRIFGQGGSGDKIYGGLGHDTIDSGAGPDRIFTHDMDTIVMDALDTIVGVG